MLPSVHLTLLGKYDNLCSSDFCILMLNHNENKSVFTMIDKYSLIYFKKYIFLMSQLVI